MSIHRDKTRGCYVFEFDRKVEGKRIRVRKLLPKTWTRTQVDTYDRQESAKLYAVATRVQRKQYLIEDAVTLYMKERVPHLKSGENIISELSLMFWAYKDKPIEALPEVCREYQEKAVKFDGTKLQAGTIRNRIRYLTSACRYAWKHHGMASSDPAERVSLPSVNNARQVYLTRSDMLKIAHACRCRSSRAMIRIAFYSGMRMSEMLNAKIEGGLFALSDSKNGNPRIIPIHPKIKSALKVSRKDRFWVSKRFKEAAKKAGFAQVRFHDLRHAAASEMINAGVDLYTVGAVLGHKSAVSTKRYSHLATDSLKVALEKIGGKKSPTTKTKRAA